MRSASARPGSSTPTRGRSSRAAAFTGLLEANGAVSMDGKGRCVDNVLIERLWRTVKYEEVYLRAYESGSQARAGLGAYFDFYNASRPHQALGYRTPAEVYAEDDNDSRSDHIKALFEEVVIPPEETSPPSEAWDAEPGVA